MKHTAHPNTPEGREAAERDMHEKGIGFVATDGGPYEFELPDDPPSDPAAMYWWKP